MGDSPKSPLQAQTTSNRRAHYNELEKKRRDKIKEEFSKLEKVVLPPGSSDPGKRVSREQILRESTNFILSKRKACDDYRREIDKMNEENNRMKEKIRQLEMNIAKKKKKEMKNVQEKKGED